jgi:DNA helicase-2/ATP-dependent DNA helicase PcrA
LEEIALVADVDTLAADMNAVTLLTLHAAKGLEYPYVFLTGLEEGILPHMRSFEEADGMAEERRLFYVGITRAMQRVYLTYAFRRLIYGESSPGIPSRFLRDIPATLTEGMSARLMKDHDKRGYLEDTTWDKAVSLPAGNTAAQARSLLSPPPTPRAPAAKDNLKYRTGQNVRHAKFGDGVVIESKRSGGDEEVTVSFKTVGIKRLAASFANLQVMD